MGLAWECVDDDALVDRACELATRAAAAPRELAVRIKASLRAAPWRSSFDDTLHAELTDQVWSFGQPWFGGRGGSPGPAR